MRLWSPSLRNMELAFSGIVQENHTRWHVPQKTYNNTSGLMVLEFSQWINFHTISHELVIAHSHHLIPQCNHVAMYAMIIVPYMRSSHILHSLTVIFQQMPTQNNFVATLQG